MKRTHYEILGIVPSAPHEIVIAVYRTWMHALKAHPDLGGDEEAAKEINAAYETLKDPASRAEYDKKIARATKAMERVENRRAPRFRVNSKIAVLPQNDGQWYSATVLDASAMGLRIRFQIVCEIGSHLTIAFEGSASEALESTVKWIREREGYTEYGVEFFRPVSDILKRLG